MRCISTRNRCKADLQHLEHTVEWRALKDGQHWAQIVLLKDEFRHPVLSTCPALERAIVALPSRVLDGCLKLLAPGGFVHEHRDISGAAPMGVVRLHVPIVTGPRRRVLREWKAIVLRSWRGVDLGYVLSTSSRQQDRLFGAYTSSLTWS